MAVKKDKPLSPRKIADYCQVNFKTVLTWIEKKQLKAAYRLPGGSNRVAREDLVNFLYEYNLPIPHDLEPNACRRVQLITENAELTETVQKLLLNNNYVLETSDNGFKAGFSFSTYRPNKLIIDMDMADYDQKKWIELITSRKLKRSYDRVNIICVAKSFSAEAQSIVRNLGANACIETAVVGEKLISAL